MEFLEESEVVREWLELELEKPDNQRVEIDAEHANSENREFVQLLAQKPDSAQVFVKFDLQWCTAKLSQAEFSRLIPIWGQKTVVEYAQEIKHGTSNLSENKQNHIEEIAGQANQYPEKWVLTRGRKPGSGPYIQDGNHRAIATALETLRGQPYEEKRVYVGYPSVDCFGITGCLRGYWHCLRGTI